MYELPDDVVCTGTVDELALRGRDVCFECDELAIALGVLSAIMTMLEPDVCLTQRADTWQVRVPTEKLDRARDVAKGAVVGIFYAQSRDED
jgi:hypothetical protein